MSLEDLIRISKMELTPEQHRQLYEAARKRAAIFDKEMEERVRRGIPDEEILNRACNL